MNIIATTLDTLHTHTHTHTIYLLNNKKQNIIIKMNKKTTQKA